MRIPYSYLLLTSTLILCSFVVMCELSVVVVFKYVISSSLFCIFIKREEREGDRRFVIKHSCTVSFLVFG